MTPVLARIAAIGAALSAVLAGVSVVLDDLTVAGVFAAVTVLSAWTCISSALAATRAQKSAEAAAEWSPERVRALITAPAAGSAGAPATADEIGSVAALRRADSRLSLIDAVTLVRAAS